LLGHWKNYDELESNLSIEELIATLKASREAEKRERKFFAAIQGIDLDAEDEEKVTMDIADLKGFQATNEGFGVNAGIGIMQLGE